MGRPDGCTADTCKPRLADETRGGVFPLSLAITVDIDELEWSLNNPPSSTVGNEFGVQLWRTGFLIIAKVQRRGPSAIRPPGHNFVFLNDKGVVDVVVKLFVAWKMAIGGGEG